jgi:S1-C subfamily serine protease
MKKLGLLLIVLSVMEWTAFIGNVNASPISWDKSISEVWEGVGRQFGSGEESTWSIKIGSDGDKYYVAYPSLDCGGNLELKKETVREKVFLEHIQYGLNVCITGGTVKLTQIEESQVQYDWYRSSGLHGASGTLRKTKPAYKANEKDLRITKDAKSKPDLSKLTKTESRSITAACYSKYLEGPAYHNQCLRSQLEVLSDGHREPDLSKLTKTESRSITAACYSKYLEGPAYHNQCLRSQLEVFGAMSSQTQPKLPPLSPPIRLQPPMSSRQVQARPQSRQSRVAPSQPSTTLPSQTKRLKTAGTGFSFGSSGYIITNYHVVKDAKLIKVRFLNGDVAEAKIIVKDESNDIAFIKPKRSPKLPGANISLGDSSAMRIGDKVFTIGFPMSNILGQQPRYSEGVINSLAGMGDDPKVFQISIPIQSGNSGGPLFNQKGEMVGIVSSSLDSANTFQIFGNAPQNVNFAIKSTFVKNLLPMIPSALISPTDIVVVPKDSNSLSGFIERVQNNIVLIEAEY